VYMFLDDNPTEGGDTYRGDREELPTGVVTLLTKCYSPSCMEGMQCYSYACPRRASVRIAQHLRALHNANYHTGFNP
jgi:hypothetical protein